MNKHDCDILSYLLQVPYANQRELAESMGCSLGSVNKTLKKLQSEGLLSEDMQPTPIAAEQWEKGKTKSAVILAAGFGMRMVPINTEIPKALIKVKGETLIERLICQLHEAGVYDISIIVGFMKEQFEYLIDQYDVKLIVNREYAQKNNLHSLALASKSIANTYIIPSDIWCSQNPFHSHELYSWYMLKDAQDAKSPVRANRLQELVRTDSKKPGNKIIGICYIREEETAPFVQILRALCADPRNDDLFWDDILLQKEMPVIEVNVVRDQDVTEINTYEDLRGLDSESPQLQSHAIQIAADALGCSTHDISRIKALKKGMTNRSFLFSCKDRRYIMRIPGEGTDQLINRREEAQVYQTIAKKHICDEIRYIDPNTGYKITEYLEGARNCDPLSKEDVRRCMARLRGFHELALKVEHRFDIFDKIDFYESLWKGQPSVYSDYNKTKEHILSLRSYIEENVEQECLTHIDAVPDNFLFVKNEQGEEEIRLIDWEYAAMQDPHVDIAMFCIYALYEPEQVEQTIDLYFTEGCPAKTRIKIYCYIAACGLLWSNWCEYKRNLGVEFGEYSLKQYRFAKDYYRLAKREMEKVNEL